MGQGTTEPVARPVTEPWAREVDEVAATLGTDVDRGLSAAEAAQRLARLGPNLLHAAAPEPRWRAVLRQFADPLVHLLLAAVVVSLVAWVVDGADDLPYDALVIATDVYVWKLVRRDMGRPTADLAELMRRLIAAALGGPAPLHT